MAKGAPVLDWVKVNPSTGIAIAITVAIVTATTWKEIASSLIRQ